MVEKYIKTFTKVLRHDKFKEIDINDENAILKLMNDEEKSQAEDDEESEYGSEYYSEENSKTLKASSKTLKNEAPMNGRQTGSPEP